MAEIVIKIEVDDEMKSIVEKDLKGFIQALQVKVQPEGDRYDDLFGILHTDRSFRDLKLELYGKVYS